MRAIILRKNSPPIILRLKKLVYVTSLFYLHNFISMHKNTEKKKQAIIHNVLRINKMNWNGAAFTCKADQK